jgi:hypothetical protein
MNGFLDIEKTILDKFPKEKWGEYLKGKDISGLLCWVVASFASQSMSRIEYLRRLYGVSVWRPALILACRNKNLKLVSYFTHEFKLTKNALENACYECDHAMIESLLERNVYSSQEIKDALLIACRIGDFTAAMHLDAVVDNQIINEAIRGGNVALVTHLLENSSYNMNDICYILPLVYDICLENNVEMLQYVLSKYRKPVGSIKMLKKARHLEIFRYLVETFNLKITPSIFNHACKHCHIDVVRHIVEKYVIEPFSCAAFIGACAYGRLETAKYLVDAFWLIDLDVKSSNNMALRLANHRMHFSVVEYLLDTFNYTRSEVKILQNTLFFHRWIYYDLNLYERIVKKYNLIVNDYYLLMIVCRNRELELLKHMVKNGNFNKKRVVSIMSSILDSHGITDAISKSILL